VSPRCPDCGALLFAQDVFLHKRDDGTIWILAPTLPHTCEAKEAS
jgi:hypothetical protein